MKGGKVNGNSIALRFRRPLSVRKHDNGISSDFLFLPISFEAPQKDVANTKGKIFDLKVDTRLSYRLSHPLLEPCNMRKSEDGICQFPSAMTL